MLFGLISVSSSNPATFGARDQDRIQALPLVPPELNPGHGHQNVVDSRREGKQQKQLLVTVKSFIQ